MTGYRLASLGFAVIALAGCQAGSGGGAPPPSASFNGSPLVTGQYPGGTFGTAGFEQPFESINSLPVGAANLPARAR